MVGLDEEEEVWRTEASYAEVFHQGGVVVSPAY